MINHNLLAITTGVGWRKGREEGGGVVRLIMIGKCAHTDPQCMSRKLSKYNIHKVNIITRFFFSVTRREVWEKGLGGHSPNSVVLRSFSIALY